MRPSRRRICSSARTLGRRFCVGSRIFFTKERPVPAERAVIEEANGVVIDLEGSARDTAITQPDQIRADPLFAQFRRRPPVMGRQPANRLDVNALAPGRQGHLFDHPASQRVIFSFVTPKPAGSHRPTRTKRYAQTLRSATPHLPRRSRSVQQGEKSTQPENCSAKV